MSEKISVNEILLRLQTAAKENDISLTYTNNLVYLKLLEYAQENKEKHDVVVSGARGVRFEITTFGFAEYCGVSPRIVTESLSKFSKCGIIKYTTAKPRPSVVMLYKQFYE